MFPKGFKILGTHAGIYKDKKKKDLAIFYSDVPATAQGVFTTNKLKSAAIKISKDNLQNGNIQAIVANSGCANTCTGARGMQDAKVLTREVASGFHITQKNVIIASTGVIGSFLPVKKMVLGVKKLSKDMFYRNKSIPVSGAEAIMTTDTVKKISVRSFKMGNRKAVIWGCAKGSGMIHPNMATMLCFILTDAKVPSPILKKALKSSVDESFNAVTVDGDTSPNDTVFVVANGESGIVVNKENSEQYRNFQKYLQEVCLDLAVKIAEDGEGARKLIKIDVCKARTQEDAKRVAELTAISPLVKTAFAGADANWGRIMAVIGRSGAAVDMDKVDIFFNGIQVVKKGMGVVSAMKRAGDSLTNKSNTVTIRLNTGKACARYTTCDMTDMYVRINANYLT